MDGAAAGGNAVAAAAVAVDSSLALRSAWSFIVVGCGEVTLDRTD